MKVAHVIQKYLPATQLRGAERYMCAVSEKLAENGRPITVLTSRAFTSNGFHTVFYNPFSRRIKKKVDKINGVNVLRFDVLYPLKVILHTLYFFSRILGAASLKERFFLLSYGPFIPNVYSHIKNSDYDIVHATPPIYVHTWLAWHAARKKKIPFVLLSLYHFEMPTLHQKNRHVDEIIKNSDAVIACTQIEKEKLIEIGVSKERIYVVPLGIEPKDWEIRAGKRFREKYGIDENDFVVLLPFKEYYKGAIHTLRAVDMLNRSTNVILVALGNTVEKEWYREIKKFKHLRIIEPGWVDENEKMDIFDGCDVLVQPSIDEAFGITYFEAWVCGKPVIGAAAGVVPEIIKDGIDGYLVEFENVDEIAGRVMHLYNNPVLRKKMGDNGRKKVLEKYTWDIAAEKLESVYKKLTLEK